MKFYSLRLKPGQDLRDELLSFANANNVRAGAIVTCVGALGNFQLRMAGATPDKQDIRTYEDHHEIVSLVGTINREACHLHISLSDIDGNVVGGHLKSSIVEMTAEVVIVEDEEIMYTRELDAQTGFPELVVKPRPKS